MQTYWALLDPLGPDSNGFPEPYAAKQHSTTPDREGASLLSLLTQLLRPVCAAPTKLFGDLHGQFGDLMRLFEEYGTPSTAGDITYIDYLFLVRAWRSTGFITG